MSKMYDTHGLTTESGQQKYGALDTFTSLEIVQALNQEDQTVAARVAQALPVIARVVDEVARSLAEGGRLIYVGAGTSGRLGVLDAAECPPTFGVDYDTIIAVIAGGDKAVRQAVEDAEDDAQKGRADVQNLDLKPKDCLLGISASGRTPYVLGALHEARGQGLLTVALSNNLNSKIGKVADIAIEIETGPEVLSGSTRLKAGTAQKLVLNMISTAVMVKLGKVYQNLMVDMRPTNAKLVYRAELMIAKSCRCSYEEAVQLFEQTQGNVKAAIVMHERHVDYETAIALLNTHQGIVRKALGN